MFGDIFPATFWPLALAHGLALLSPGPDFMLIVSRGTRNQLCGSIFICLGITAGNALYVGLAIAGWIGIGGRLWLQRPLEIAGAAYLAWLGTMLLRAAASPPEIASRTDADNVPLSPGAQFGLGLGSALLNPKNMVFYLTIMTVLLEANTRLHQRIAVGMWMCVAVLLWDVTVAVCVSHPFAQRFLWNKTPLIEKLCGIFLLGIAVSLLVAPWL